jgi:SAM-dependent methyltransferase
MSSTPTTSFDSLAAEYEQLLEDPLRRRFAASNAFFIHQKCRALIRELRGNLGPGPWKILDVGCGQGTAVSFLSPYGTVVGADVSFQMLRQGSRGVDLVVQEPFDLPFVSGSFDAVFASCVYHHVQAADHARHLQELSRVLRPGGLVVVFEHNPLNPITRCIFNRAIVDRGCAMIPRRRLVELFHTVGLREVRHKYVLFVPQVLSTALGFLEPRLARLPFGGQYFVAGHKAS